MDAFISEHLLAVISRMKGDILKVLLVLGRPYAKTKTCTPQPLGHPVHSSFECHRIIPLSKFGLGSLRMRRLVLICFILWFIGKYNKYSWVLSQTPWLINNVRHCESSVEVKRGRNRYKIVRIYFDKCTGIGRIFHISFLTLNMLTLRLL